MKLLWKVQTPPDFISTALNPWDVKTCFSFISTNVKNPQTVLLLLIFFLNVHIETRCNAILCVQWERSTGAVKSFFPPCVSYCANCVCVCMYIESERQQQLCLMLSTQHTNHSRVSFNLTVIWKLLHTLWLFGLPYLMQKLCNLKCVVILIKFRWKWESLMMAHTKLLSWTVPCNERNQRRRRHRWWWWWW